MGVTSIFVPRLGSLWYPPNLTLTSQHSQTGAWGDVKKPQHNIAFLMMAPSNNIEGKQISGLAVVWAHPCQGCLTTLAEAACKLALLIDDSLDWPYAFACMSSTTCHAPLSDAGHLGAMTDGIWSVMHVAIYTNSRHGSYHNTGNN